MISRSKRIYVAGHGGMVGSAIVRRLHAAGQTQIIARTHAELDLAHQQGVNDLFASEKIDEVYLAAFKRNPPTKQHQPTHKDQ